MITPQSATAIAHANFAFIKYWGKRDTFRNLPAVPSLSLTVDGLWTRTCVTFDPDLTADELVIGDRPENGPALDRVSRFLDRVRDLAAIPVRARVVTENNFPTSAGLASSASAFAALAQAATAAAGLHLSGTELSRLARRGSGSAARSVFGGFVELVPDPGQDDAARQLVDGDHWPLQILIAITDPAPKSTGSTAAMETARHTSPFFDAWVQSQDKDMKTARQAILRRDFDTLADVMEQNCLKMHSVSLSSRPGHLYWLPATVALIHAIRKLRKRGTPVCFTIDAGPQVKAVCVPEVAHEVRKELAAVPGVKNVLATGPGPGVRLLGGNGC